MLRVASFPAVVRGFAPPTGGYEASDRKRSSTRLALTRRMPSCSTLTVRPYTGLHVSSLLVSLYYNGRTDRASLQRATRLALTELQALLV